MFPFQMVHSASTGFLLMKINQVNEKMYLVAKTRCFYSFTIISKTITEKINRTDFETLLARKSCYKI